MTKALDRILVSAGIIVAVCAVARAEPVASPVAPATAAPYPRNRLALVLGIGSPFGEVGLSYQRQLAPSFAIEGGVGAGLTGTQFPLLAKTMTGGGQMHVYLEVGPSLSLRESKTALWAVAEVGLELSLGNWIVAFGAGATVIVAGSVPDFCFGFCDTYSTLDRGFWIPEIRLTLGRRF